MSEVKQSTVRAVCVKLGWELRPGSPNEEFIGHFVFDAPPDWPIKYAWGKHVMLIGPLDLLAEEEHARAAKGESE